MTRPDGTVVVPVPPAAPSRNAQVQAAHSRRRRVARHEQIWALRRQGWSGQAIARQLQMAKSTGFRSLRSATCAERTYKRRGPSILNPYKDTVLEHWNRGCHDALRGVHLLQQRGYRGSYATVARYAQRLRQAQGLAPRQRQPAQCLPGVGEPQHGQLTPRGAAWLVLRRPDRRNLADAQQLTQLMAQQVDLAETVGVARDFAELVRTRHPDRLDAWLARATTRALGAVQRFAHGLRDDYEAVTAGVTLPWSNGPVAGHMNRLKLGKRQMFGRAKLDLLQRRFLLAPRHAQGHTPRARPSAEPLVPAAAA